jgi:hypothetical protein
LFVSETELDRYFETTDGVVWVTGLVRILDGRLLIDRLLVYPATGARQEIGVRQMLAIVRSLTEEAIAQGLSGYSVKAERVYEDRPTRMISIKRRLR